MTEKKLHGAGLRGQLAGETALCTVGKTGAGLTYRGFDIKELANNAQFEEVAYLLLYGKLPNQVELNTYKVRLKNMRCLPDALKRVLEQISNDVHPMDVMRTGCSMLGNLETEKNFSEQMDHINRMLAIFPGMINYWYNFSHKGVTIDVETEADSIAEQFLWTLYDRKPELLNIQVMNASLILYAEHEFNASTFTARVCASTLSDIHSCITGAIGSLRGPLHGGANEAVIAIIENLRSIDEVEEYILNMLARKDKIMGFGHAIYRKFDPRNEIIKKWSKKLSDHVGDKYLYAISERIEEVMWREKKLFCNADFFHASVYKFMNIPTKLFTPIFVCARVVGWSAHVIEQRSNNRIIRPSANYTGPKNATWIAIENRS